MDEFGGVEEGGDCAIGGCDIDSGGGELAFPF